GTRAARLLPASPRRGAVAHAHLRGRLGRALRRPVKHTGGSRQGPAPQAGGARPAAHPHSARPRLPLRQGRRRAGGRRMGLAPLLSLFFLGSLALTLAGFSVTLYVLAARHLDRQLDRRLESALAALTAAVEIKDDGVEWEPHQRRLDLPGVRWLARDPH